MQSTLDRILSDLEHTGLRLRTAGTAGYVVRPPGGSYRSPWVRIEGCSIDQQRRLLAWATRELEILGWVCRSAPGPALLVEASVAGSVDDIEPVANTEPGRRLDWPGELRSMS